MKTSLLQYRYNIATTNMCEEWYDEHPFFLSLRTNNVQTHLSPWLPSQLHCVCAQLLCRVQLCATLWTAAHQTPLSMGFSRQEYWSGFHALLQRIFPTYRLNLGLLHCRQMLYTEPLGKPESLIYLPKRSKWT